MRGMVDNTPPPTMGMRHLRVNWKKAELTAERYDTIERDNRHLLNHMNDIGGKREYTSATRSQSLPILRDPPGGPHRKQELDRINQENRRIQTRLRSTEAEYRVRDWEAQYKQTAAYVRIRCEYEPPLLPAPRAPFMRTTGRMTDRPDVVHRPRQFQENA